MFQAVYGQRSCRNGIMRADIEKSPEWVLRRERFLDGLEIVEGIPLMHTWITSGESVRWPRRPSRKECGPPKFNHVEFADDGCVRVGPARRLSLRLDCGLLPPRPRSGRLEEIRRGPDNVSIPGRAVPRQFYPNAKLPQETRNPEAIGAVLVCPYVRNRPANPSLS
jgi:hypothetical protein